MKAILMMILSIGFIGNVMAACPQDMGYVAPVDVLPVCETGKVNISDSHTQIQSEVAESVPSPPRVGKAKTIAENYPLCPKDMGYLAPADMLPPCSDSNIGQGTHAVSAKQEAVAPAGRPAPVQLLSMALPHDAKIHLERESPLR